MLGVICICTLYFSATFSCPVVVLEPARCSVIFVFVLYIFAQVFPARCLCYCVLLVLTISVVSLKVFNVFELAI